MIKVAMLWLTNEAGGFLLARRADHKARDPGLWGPSVTGGVEPGETFDQTVVRETQEELGLKPGSYTPEFIFETDFAHPDGEMRHFAVYKAQIPQAAIHEMNIDHNEVAEVQWMAAPEIKKLLESDEGHMVVASAHVLWDAIFAALEK